MPSPIAHALAGVAIAWSAPRDPRPSGSTRGAPLGWKLAVACATLGALPDIDLLYLAIHRSITHSIPVAILVTIISVVVTGWVTRTDPVPERGQLDVKRRSDTAWIGLSLGAAWSSHVLLDWLGADANPPYGIQMLWPFSEQWFVSGWGVFRGTERRDPFSVTSILKNSKAAIQEIAVMGPVVWAVWFARRAGRADKTQVGPTRA